MVKASKLTHTLKWSWDDFRQQDKTSEKRNQVLNYNSGILLPTIINLSGSWDWSRDETENKAGLANTAERDFKMLDLNVTKFNLKTGPLNTTLTGLAGLKEQKAVNQNIHNDFSEASTGGRIKSDYQLSPGLKVAGRVFGKTIGGDRSLGTFTSPSSAIQDTMGVRLTFDQRFVSGFFALTRSHFEDEYLDFTRNSNGLIDTVGRDEADKIVEEMKTKNALSLDFENKSRLGKYGLNSKLNHKGSDLGYMSSGLGSTERSEDNMDLILFRASARDSIALKYHFGWKWDDQRIKGATANRGRQYGKDRGLDFYWKHFMFRATELTLKFQQGLSQSIAENRFNQNDRDRIRQDLTLTVNRRWMEDGKPVFQANMLFAYKTTEDLSIRSTRSSNNNAKDSYEIAPGFDWDLASWLNLNQSYRVYIQYTDYLFSDLESVNKRDNYNKRGNLNTRVTLKPTKRLTVVVKNDYNKRFNATRTLTDVTGNSYYHVDDRQVNSDIDLGVRFAVAKGITIEGATYSSLDEKEKIGNNIILTENRAGRVWVGAKIDRKWGPPKRPLKFSALVKKYSAYGPAVTETSDDFWEADIWLNWTF